MVRSLKTDAEPKQVQDCGRRLRGTIAALEPVVAAGRGEPPLEGRSHSWRGGATAGGAEPSWEGRSHSWRDGATLTEGSMTPIQHQALIQETEVRGQQEQVWIRGTTLGPPMTPPSRAPPLCTK